MIRLTVQSGRTATYYRVVLIPTVTCRAPSLSRDSSSVDSHAYYNSMAAILNWTEDWQCEWLFLYIPAAGFKITTTGTIHVKLKGNRVNNSVMWTIPSIDGIVDRGLLESFPRAFPRNTDTFSTASVTFSSVDSQISHACILLWPQFRRSLLWLFPVPEQNRRFLEVIRFMY